jgi:hypothetical protein
MTSQIDCRSRAEECRRNAADTNNPADKEAWLALAQNWLTLARDISEDGLPRMALRMIQGGREN